MATTPNRAAASPTPAAAPAPATSATPAAAPAPAAAPVNGKRVFKKIKSVTLPLIKLAFNAETYIYVHGPMYEGEKLDKQKAPATLLHGVDLETGEEGVIICPAIMVRELLKNYGSAGYVGKCFSIIKSKSPDADKRFNLVNIDEVAAPDDFKHPSTPPQVGAPGAIEKVIAGYERAMREREAA